MDLLYPVGGRVYRLAMTTADGISPRGIVVLRLGITGELGQMDFMTVLSALQGSYELLQRTAHRVLGDRADQLKWQLTGLEEGSAMTLVRTTETFDVSEREIREIIETYTRDLADPAERLPEDDIPVLRELLMRLQKTESGGLLAELEGSTQRDDRVVVEPSIALPLLNVTAPGLHHVIGSVTGMLESINVHGKREASLYNELDRRRVIVSFPEADYLRVHAALRRRVEVFGMLQEDADGRPLRLRMQDLEVLLSDDQLPSLGSLAGSMPNLTGGATAEEHLDRNRREFGFG